MQEESISSGNSFWCKMEKEWPKSTSLLSDGPQRGVDLQRDGLSVRVAAESRAVTAATKSTALGWGLGSISGSATNLHVRLMAHWLFFLPLLKDIAIFDNNPSWNSVVSIEGKHCIQTGVPYMYFYFFKEIQIHGYKGEKLEFSGAPIFQGLTRKQAFLSFATTKLNSACWVWKGRFLLQNNLRTLTTKVCGFPLPLFIFTSSRGWQTISSRHNSAWRGRWDAWCSITASPQILRCLYLPWIITTASQPLPAIQ